MIASLIAASVTTLRKSRPYTYRYIHTYISLPVRDIYIYMCNYACVRAELTVLLDCLVDMRRTYTYKLLIIIGNALMVIAWL